MNTRVIPKKKRRAGTVQGISRVTHIIGRAVEIGFGEGVVNEATGFFQLAGGEQTFLFMGENYSELLAAAPRWSPSKPAGTWREADLFALMDYIESGQAEKDRKSKINQGVGNAKQENAAK